MTSDQQAIRNLVALWHSATAVGDIEAILGLMAEDVVFLGSGRPPMRGRSSFESALRKLLATHRIESTGEVKEVVVSGDWAYCWTTQRQRGAAHGMQLRSHVQWRPEP